MALEYLLITLKKVTLKTLKDDAVFTSIGSLFHIQITLSVSLIKFLIIRLILED